MSPSSPFEMAFEILKNVDLFGSGPPMPRNGQTDEDLIKNGRCALPGLYQDTYVEPLLRNLKCIQARSGETVETLAGAVYDHAPQSPVINHVKRFVALISNVYRSFIEPEPSAKTTFPLPQSLAPALATFTPVLDLQNFHIAPFTLPVDEVNRLCGASIAVVSLPSCYRDHPILCWGSIAHEAGGHDVLHAYVGLLRELQGKVRYHFYRGPDPGGQAPLNKDQFLGLLWQYWTEEAASDVCAVMNVGPAYGRAIAVYFAALNEQARWYYLSNQQGKRDFLPLLTVSWPPDPRYTLPYVDYHPTDILKLYVVMGAIDALPLDPAKKDKYKKEIKECIDIALQKDPNPTTQVNICGKIQFKPGRWVTVGVGLSRFPIDRSEMQQHAFDVGRLIATTSLDAFNGNTLLDLEVWDDSDEGVAEQIRQELKTNYNKKDAVTEMGDDAHLLAGSLLALFDDPTHYGDLNKRLEDALDASFDGDPVWGTPAWHPISGLAQGSNVPVSAKGSGLTKSSPVVGAKRPLRIVQG